MESIKKSIDERAQLKREYDRRVNKRLMQTQESKVDSSKALDVTECSKTKSDKQDTSSSLGNYLTHVVDADIRPVNDQVSFAKNKDVSFQSNKTGKNQDAPEFHEFFEINDLKAQLQAKTTLICNLKNQIKSVKEASNEAKVKNDIDGIETIYIELEHIQEYVLAKPHHMIAPSSSRNSQEESYGSNDMDHKYYLEEARKKTQERNRNSKSSVMHTTSLQNTTNGSKQNPRSNNQTSRSSLVSKSSGVTLNSVPLVDHSRNSSSGPGPQLMAPGIINSGLVQNIPSPTPTVLPTKNDWDSLFQPIFNEYFKPPPNVDHPVPEVPTLVPAASTSSPFSTTVGQDELSTSISQTTLEQQSSVIPQGVEDDFYDIKVAHIDNDPYFGILIS
ncbi:hypothetical protein Tco_0913691 [Tanacetum coccineum]